MLINITSNPLRYGAVRPHICYILWAARPIILDTIEGREALYNLIFRGRSPLMKGPGGPVKD